MELSFVPCLVCLSLKSKDCLKYFEAPPIVIPMFHCVYIAPVCLGLHLSQSLFLRVRVPARKDMLVVCNVY